MVHSSSAVIRIAIGIVGVFLLIIIGGLFFIQRLEPEMSVPSAPAPLSVRAQFNGNNFVGALKTLDETIARDPRNVSLLLQRALTLAQEGSIEFKEKEYAAQAISAAQQVLAIDSKNSDAWRIIGYAHEISQEYPAAHEAYQKSLALNPHNVATISQEAHAYDLEGQLTPAEAGYRKALSLNPTFEQAIAGLARINVAHGNYTQAIPLFDAVAHSAQNVRTVAESYYSEGTLVAFQGNHLLAGALMASSTISDPQYSLGWAGLGQEQFEVARATSTGMSIAQRQDILAQSFTSLIKAIALNPNQSAAHYQLGFELAFTGQNAAAAKVLDETLAIIPNDITLNTSDKAALIARTKATRAVVTKTLH